MQYTPFGGLTDDELVANVLNDESATARELELVIRIGSLQEHVKWLERETVGHNDEDIAAKNLRGMPA